MTKQVRDFSMRLKTRGGWGDIWEGKGWVDGQFRMTDAICLWLSKKEIEKILKFNLRNEGV